MGIKAKGKIRKVRYIIDLPKLPIYNYQGVSLELRHFVSVDVKGDRTKEIESAIWYALRRIGQGKVQMDKLRKNSLGQYTTRLEEFDADPRKRKNSTDSYGQLSFSDSF